MPFEAKTGTGVVASYGPRETNQKYGGVVDTGAVKRASWTFKYNDLPTYGTTRLEHIIPAYAKILSCRLEVLTAFAGGTSYAVGTYQATGATSPGTVVDADGFITDANAPLANINARGKFVVGTGALINAAATAEPMELQVTATGTFTAGEARVIVEYIVEAP